MSGEKLSYIISFYFVCVHFCHGIEDAYFKSHRSFVILCNLWAIMSDVNMSYGKISDFVSFLLIERFCFTSHWNTFLFFDRKN